MAEFGEIHEQGAGDARAHARDGLQQSGQLARTATVVVLEPDVAQVLDTSVSVNSALRALAAIPRPRKRKRAG